MFRSPFANDKKLCNDLFIFIVALIVTVVGIAGIFVIGKRAVQQQVTQQINFKKLDHEIAQEIEIKLRSHLAGLKPTHPLIKRFGAFRFIEGSGEQRVGEPLENRPIILRRQFVFADGAVPGLISIERRAPLEFELSIAEIGDFDHRTNRQFQIPTVLGSVAHPEFAPNVSVSREMTQAEGSVEEMFELLHQGATQDDREKLAAVLNWYHTRRVSDPINSLLRRALRHPDERVRYEAVRIVGTPETTKNIYFAESTINELLIAATDADQPSKVRCAAVFAILHGWEQDRKRLYERLKAMGDEGLFTVAPIAEYIAKISTENGAIDAPTGAVELLQNWGPAAAEAVPALILAIENHENRWNFVPAVIKALGAMGPTAKAAVPVLVRATGDQNGNIQAAAHEALRRIQSDDDLSMLRASAIPNLAAKPCTGRRQAASQFECRISIDLSVATFLYRAVTEHSLPSLVTINRHNPAQFRNNLWSRGSMSLAYGLSTNLS